MVKMITVKFSCDQCGLVDVACEVPAREDPDLLDVVQWFQTVVLVAISDLHRALSPTCQSGTLANVIIVWGCQCNRGRKYEDFIWENRHLIAKYIRARADAELKLPGPENDDPDAWIGKPTNFIPPDGLPPAEPDLGDAQGKQEGGPPA
jgi:hypothetical protein